MQRLFLLINTLTLSLICVNSFAQELAAFSDIPPLRGAGVGQRNVQELEAYPPSSSQGENSMLAFPLAEMRFELHAEVSRVEDGVAPSSFLIKEETGTIKPQRSVKKAFIFSAIVPGAGELYNRSYLTAIAFLGIEVGAWALHSKYNNRGNELTDEFELYANTHWSEERYWESLARDSGGKCAASDRTCLKDYERDSFSHFLPDSKNQTYYENIGKYDQFNAGWDDSQSGDARQRDSVNRESYTFMRLDANKQFKNATRATTVVLVNHLLSALHAAYSTHRYNQSAKAVVGLKMESYKDELVPTLSMNVAW